MSTDVVRSLTRLELLELLDEAEQREVARSLRSYLEHQPELLEQLRAAVEPTLVSWSVTAERPK